MFLKTISIISLLFLSLCLNAQNEYSNRWKEIKRTDRKDKPVAFSDTMHLNNVTPTSLKMRRGSFEYNGIISNDLLEIGEDQYQIIKQDSIAIFIGDEDYVHIFARQIKDQSAADATSSINELSLPSKPVNNIDEKLLSGEWKAYKRIRKSGITDKIDYKILIQSITFRSVRQDNSNGTVAMQDGKTATIQNLQAAFINIIGVDGKEHAITVWKLTKEELIVEDENGFLYYMKQF